MPATEAGTICVYPRFALDLPLFVSIRKVLIRVNLRPTVVGLLIRVHSRSGFAFPAQIFGSI
jgi:hypothetical protein